MTRQIIPLDSHFNLKRHSCMSHLVRPHSYTQYIRIFVIVNLTSFLITRSALESYWNRQARAVATEHPERFTPKAPKQPAFKQREPSRTTYPPYLQTPTFPTDDRMAPKKENTKKVSGNAKKAEAAAQKQATADAAVAAQEEDKWSQGAKSKASKKAEAEEKKAAAAAAKAERDRLLAEEEKDQPAKPKSAGAKKAEKKAKSAESKGTLDMGQLDGDDTPADKKERTLNATGIDNALDALSLATESNAQAVERHPERRFKAAYKAYVERRLPEVEQETPGLRRNQRVELIKKEFERSEENPFNQVGNVRYDASKDDLKEEKERLKKGVEGRLGEL